MYGDDPVPLSRKSFIIPISRIVYSAAGKYIASVHGEKFGITNPEEV